VNGSSSEKFPATSDVVQIVILVIIAFSRRQMKLIALFLVPVPVQQVNHPSSKNSSSLPINLIINFSCTSLPADERKTFFYSTYSFILFSLHLPPRPSEKSFFSPLACPPARQSSPLFECEIDFLCEEFTFQMSRF
jgi:hypothetical protein